MDLVKQLSFWIKIRLQLLVLPFVTVIILLAKADNFSFLATNYNKNSIKIITHYFLDYRLRHQTFFFIIISFLTSGIAQRLTLMTNNTSCSVSYISSEMWLTKMGEGRGS